MKDTEDDAAGDPNNKQPARPIETVEHTHDTENRETLRDLAGPKFKWTWGAALHGQGVSQRQPAARWCRTL